MAQALRLAKQAQFETEPNPMVGALLVSGSGQVLSEGFHQKAGRPHAEVNVLSSFDQVPADSTLYVTLEPCNHQGRTPACTSLLLKKGVKHLVVGTLDPNPQMSGNSLAQLKKAGVQVETGCLAAECQALNRVFNCHITQHRPFVTAKTAITLDGKIANSSGESQWITCEAARAFGHQLRSEHQAIAIGRGTLVADNPKLTNRNHAAARQPTQVLFANQLDWPEGLHFFVPKTPRSFLFTSSQAQANRVEELERQGLQVIRTDSSTVEIHGALQRLYQQGITSLLLEGGGQLFASFLQENLIDRICAFMAPRIMGQPTAPSFAGDIGLRQLSEIPNFHFAPPRFLGRDLLVELYQREADVHWPD